MRLGFFLLSLIGPALSLAYDDSRAQQLPPCNADYRPCRCPSGTTFKNLTSYGVIGAPAAEVQNIMGKCERPFKRAELVSCLMHPN